MVVDTINLPYLEHFLEEVSFFYTKFAVCKANLETTQLHFSLNQMCVKEKKQRLVRCFFFGYDINPYTTIPPRKIIIIFPLAIYHFKTRQNS